MKTIIFRHPGNLLRGKPVALWFKQFVNLGPAKGGWGKSLFSIYADCNGYENGTCVWVNVHLFRRSYSCYVVKIN